MMFEKNLIDKFENYFDFPQSRTNNQCTNIHYVLFFVSYRLDGSFLILFLTPGELLTILYILPITSTLAKKKKEDKNKTCIILWMQ